MVCGWNTVLVGVRTATEELESIIEYIQPPRWYSKSQNQPIGYSINWANDLSTFRNSDCFLSVTVGFKLVHSFQCFPFNPTEFTTRCRKVGQSTSWQDRNVQICHTNFFGWKSHLLKICSFASCAMYHHTTAVFIAWLARVLDDEFSCGMKLGIFTQPLLFLLLRRAAVSCLCYATIDSSFFDRHHVHHPQE